MVLYSGYQSSQKPPNPFLNFPHLDALFKQFIQLQEKRWFLPCWSSLFSWLSPSVPLSEQNAQLVYYQIYMKKLTSEIILTHDDLIYKLWIVSSPLTYGFCFLVPLSAGWFSSGTLGSVSHSFLSSVMKKEDIPLRNLIYVLTKYCRKVSQNVSTHLKRSGFADAMDHSCWI